MIPQADAVLNETVPGELDPSVESDMLASFADEKVEEHPTTAPGGDDTNSAKTDTPPSPSEAPPSDAIVEVPVGESTNADRAAELLSGLQRLTTLEADIKRLADGVYGRVGSIEQLIKTLQSATPEGQTLEVSSEDFKDLQDEFPMLADLQVKALNRVLGKFKGTGVSPDFAAGVVRESESAARKAADAHYTARRVQEFHDDMAETHPDWQTIVGLPETDGGPLPQTEYHRWLATQPPDYRTRVLESFSAVVVGKSIDKFHAWKQAQQTPKLASTSSSKPSATNRQHQLRAAVVPRSSGSQPQTKKDMTEEEAMMASFANTL